MPPSPPMRRPVALIRRSSKVGLRLQPQAQVGAAGDREAVEVERVELVAGERAAHAAVVGEGEAGRGVVAAGEAGAQPVGEPLAGAARGAQEHGVGPRARRRVDDVVVAAEPLRRRPAELAGGVELAAHAAGAAADQVDPVAAARGHPDRPGVVAVGEPVELAAGAGGGQALPGGPRRLVRRDHAEPERLPHGVGQRRDADQVGGAGARVEVQRGLAAPVRVLAAERGELRAGALEHLDGGVHVAAGVERDQDLPRRSDAERVPDGRVAAGAAGRLVLVEGRVDRRPRDVRGDRERLGRGARVVGRRSGLGGGGAATEQDEEGDQQEDGRAHAPTLPALAAAATPHRGGRVGRVAGCAA